MNYAFKLCMLLRAMVGKFPLFISRLSAAPCNFKYELIHFSVNEYVNNL